MIFFSEIPQFPVDQEAGTVLGTLDEPNGRDIQVSPEPEASVDDDVFDEQPREKGDERSISRDERRLTRREILVSFLRDHGYKRVAEMNFRGPSGTTVRIGSGPVHGKEWDAAGEIAGLYWVATAPLAKGFTIPADSWSMLDRNPDVSWVILPDEDGAILAYPFDRFRNDVDIFPAEYRVRLVETLERDSDSDSPSFVDYAAEDIDTDYESYQNDDYSIDHLQHDVPAEPFDDEQMSEMTPGGGTSNEMNWAAKNVVAVESMQVNGNHAHHPSADGYQDDDPPSDRGLPEGEVAPTGSKRTDKKYLSRVARIRERLRNTS